MQKNVLKILLYKSSYSETQNSILTYSIYILVHPKLYTRVLIFMSTTYLNCVCEI